MQNNLKFKIQFIAATAKNDNNNNNNNNKNDVMNTVQRLPRDVVML